MHHLSRFSPFSRAREQGNHASDDPVSGEAEGVMAASTNSNGPTPTQANGVGTESNIDVSVIAQPPAALKIDQSTADSALGSLLGQAQQGKLTRMETGQRPSRLLTSSLATV